MRTGACWNERSRPGFKDSTEKFTSRSEKPMESSDQ